MRLAKQYALYLLRWQLSTPILAVCLVWLGGLGELPATIIANLIGGLIFFWVDKLIFRSNRKEEEAPEPLEPTFIDLDERIKEKEEG